MSKVRQRKTQKSGEDGSKQVDQTKSSTKQTPSATKLPNFTIFLIILCFAGFIFYLNFVNFSSVSKQTLPLQKEAKSESVGSEVPPEIQPAQAETVQHKTDGEKKAPKPSLDSENSKTQHEKYKQKYASYYQKINSPIKNLSLDAIKKYLQKIDTALQNTKQNNPESPDICYLTNLYSNFLNLQAEKQMSNQVLTQAIASFQTLPPTCNPHLILENCKILRNRAEFIGQTIKITKYLKSVLNHPEISAENSVAANIAAEINLMLATIYLINGKNQVSLEFFESIVALSRLENLSISDSILAETFVNYGWVNGKLAEEAQTENLKLSLYDNCIAYTEQGINLAKKSDANYGDVTNPRYFRQLADAYLRTDRRYKFDEVNQLAADLKINPSKYQRSSYNVEGLTAKPFWTPQQAGVEKFVAALEKPENYQKIKAEALLFFEKHLNKMEKESEALSVNDGTTKSDWRQATFFSRGQKHTEECMIGRFTCMLIEKYAKQKAANCKRGQTKFSVMLPGTKVWPHVGPTNTRLRMHLGLIVPAPREKMWLKVAGIKQHWLEGKVFIFDDSFEHEVEHNGDSFRMILIIDIWHPELDANTIKKLTPI